MSIVVTQAKGCFLLSITKNEMKQSEHGNKKERESDRWNKIVTSCFFLRGQSKKIKKEHKLISGAKLLDSNTNELNEYVFVCEPDYYKVGFGTAFIKSMLSNLEVHITFLLYAET